jgi:hypothetical protein
MGQNARNVVRVVENSGRHKRLAAREALKEYSARNARQFKQRK